MAGRFLAIGAACLPAIPAFAALVLVAITSIETIARMDALLLKLEGGFDALGHKVDSTADVINRDLVEMNKNLRRELGLP